LASRLPEEPFYLASVRLRRNQKGEVMTRSVNELRRESELSRAELAATVSQLKVRISDTAEDIRHKASPQHIKAEVSDYISHKTQTWFESLKQRAMENPMQAIAVGAAIAAPALRMARTSSLPLLMVGAGLALTSKTVRERSAAAISPVVDKAAEVVGDVAERAQGLGANLRDGLASATTQAADMAKSAQDAAAGVAENVSSRTAEIAGNVKDKIGGGMEAAAGATAEAGEAASAAPAKARHVIGENAALIGGLGIAIGAIIAAALPQTKTETSVMGQASESVKQAAEAAAQSGFEAAKDATMSAADAAAKSITEADLGGHASRMTQNMADKFKEAADDTVSAAFSPKNPNT
jgi:hypothetical protein